MRRARPRPGRSRARGRRSSRRRHRVLAPRAGARRASTSGGRDSPRAPPSTSSTSSPSRSAICGGGRKLPELLGERTGRLVDLHRQLLQAAGQSHGPYVIAEVAPQLAEDRRHGVGGERSSALGVEAVDRLHQPEVRDLDQVVDRLGLAPVAKRERAREAMKRLTSSSRSSGERVRAYSRSRACSSRSPTGWLIAAMGPSLRLGSTSDGPPRRTMRWVAPCGMVALSYSLVEDPNRVVPLG